MRYIRFKRGYIRGEMGYINNHSIIVTGDGQELEKAHKKAEELFRYRNHLKEEISIVSSIIPHLRNSKRTFLVAPDGSKEGWELSDQYDKKREKFMCYLDYLNHENLSAIEYIEIAYDEENFTKIMQTNTHSNAINNYYSYKESIKDTSN